jgi:hypothetical protein
MKEPSNSGNVGGIHLLMFVVVFLSLQANAEMIAVF